MSGARLKNLELFASLCGAAVMPHVTLVTTMWDHLVPEVGEEREKKLKESFWHDMIAKGCAVQRFDGTKEGAWRIIQSSRAIGTFNVLVATEIVDRHRELDKTEAGTTLNRQLEKRLKDQKEANRRLKALTNNQNQKSSRQELEKRVDELDSKISQTSHKMRELKLPLTKRLVRLFRSVSTLIIQVNIFSNFGIVQLS
jgi:chromosome condensin MukBEF ATPase and DNA-binding subunit MukB